MKTLSKREIVRRAEAVDSARRHQIDNQVASIDRLLVDGSYDAEMAELHRRLAEAQADLQELEA